MLMERGRRGVILVPDDNRSVSTCSSTLVCLFVLSPQIRTVSLTLVFIAGSETSGQPAIRTGYTCEGDEMVVACEAEETIQIVRANYGRFSIFSIITTTIITITIIVITIPITIITIIIANHGRFSIAICNDDGKTHWSVNCMSPKTRHILQNK